MENRLPETLLEATRYFEDTDVCREFVAMWRWPDGVACPHCKRETGREHREVMFLKTRKIWKCKVCRKQFSVKAGTIFEDSPLPLDKWLIAVWIIVNAKNGSSSCEVARAIGVPQKTAWFMLHRIRRAMKAGTLEKMEGTVEVDETFGGGLEKNKHKDKKQNAGRGGVGKAIVLGVLQRGNGTKDELGRTRRHQDRIFSKVQTGAEVFTDAHKGYNGLDAFYKHAFVDHAIEYAEGRYMDEQSFRFNHRSGTDLTRFMEVLRRVADKRLTYDELTTSHLEYIVAK